MGVLGRLRRRRPAAEAERYADDDSLAVWLRAFDPARADSAVLAAAAAAGVDLDRPFLVRHHLRLPDSAAVAAAAPLLAGDGYAVVAEEPDDAGVVYLRASRTEVLTALGAAQERARMAGLAQRLGGDALGWDAGRPAEPAE